MPTATAIAIDNGEATPVSHTFTPKLVSPAESVFKDTTANTSAGEAKITLGFSPASAKRASTRMSIRVDLPIEETVSGVTTVAHTARFIGDIVIPDLMTQANRDNMYAYIKNLIAHASVASMVKDLDPQY